MDGSSVPLLTTKLYTPPQRPNLVLRPRLMVKLGEALQRRYRLILISAKAGSGKTTLVSEWVHQQGRPTVWLSLDANDNDPRRFFSYLVATTQQLDPKIGQTVLNQLEFPQLPPAETLVVELVNDVASSSIPFILVLDDYHLIQRDKVSLDIFWLKDESLEDTENLPHPDVLAQEIVENLEAALMQFSGIIETLGEEEK